MSMWWEGTKLPFRFMDHDENLTGGVKQPHGIMAQHEVEGWSSTIKKNLQKFWNFPVSSELRHRWECRNYLMNENELTKFIILFKAVLFNIEETIVGYDLRSFEG